MAIIDETKTVIPSVSLLQNSPFYSIINYFMPNSIKELFQWVNYCIENDPLVSAIITKKAEYPITDVIIDEKCGDEEKAKEFLTAMKDDMKIKEKLIKFNKEFFGPGNVFVTVVPRHTRRLVCKQCKESFPFMNVDFNYSMGRFKGKCKHCGAATEYKIEDHITTEAPKILFLDVLNIDVDYDEVLDDYVYYYNIPNKTKRKLQSTKSKKYLYEIPEKFFESIIKNEKIVFTSQTLYHAKNVTTSSYKFKGYGMPPLQPVLRSIFFKQMLRKANTVIATDRITGKRYVSPVTANSNGVGMSSVSPGVFRRNVMAELKKHQKDKDYIAVFPEPVNFGNISGEGKMYFTINEEKMLDEEIMAGMNVPPEFVKGGLTWSGSSVSLRMLENEMLNSRIEVINFLNFVSKMMSSLHKLDFYPKFTLKKFKMADDSQKQQHDLSLVDRKLLSGTKYMEEYGNNFKEEQQQIERDELVARAGLIQKAKNDALTARIQTLETMKAQITATKMQTELALQNFDQSYQVKDLKVSPEVIKTWKNDYYRMGGLSQAVNGELETQKQQMQLQMEAQSQMEQGQPTEQTSGQDQEQIAQQLAGQILSALNEGQSLEEIQKQMMSGGIPQDIAEYALQLAQEQYQGNEQSSEQNIQAESGNPTQDQTETQSYISQDAETENLIAMARQMQALGTTVKEITDFLIKKSVDNKTLSVVIANLEDEQSAQEQSAQEQSEYPTEDEPVYNSIQETNYLKDTSLFEFFMTLVGVDANELEQRVVSVLGTLNELEKEEFLNKLQIFLIVESAISSGYSQNQIFNILKSNGVSLNGFAIKAINVINANNQQVDTSFFKKDNTSKTNTINTAQQKPLPEVKPPRRDNSPI